MNSRATVFWVILAGGLFAFIYFIQPGKRPPPPPPQTILPDLKAAEISEVAVLPQNQLQIRVEQTNHTWKLTLPISYPADDERINQFLQMLEHLVPAAYLRETELRNQFTVDEDYGFAKPLASVIVRQGNHRTHLKLGSLTAPGDQVFVQVVGVGGLYVVDAGLIQKIPKRADVWRRKQLLDDKPLGVMRIGVTNQGKVLEVVRPDPKAPWKMSQPFPARADSGRINDLLGKLVEIKAASFVSDDPKADLDAYGLQNPSLIIGIGQATNMSVVEFGRAVTNDAEKVYARLAGRGTIVTVARDVPDIWGAGAEKFRDPHLVTLSTDPVKVAVKSEDQFALAREGGGWQITPQNYRVDNRWVEFFVNSLTNLQISVFAKDVVTEPDLPTFGLTQARRQFVISGPSPGPGQTNSVLVTLNFGATNQDIVYALRSDESSVYGIKLQEFEKLAQASWQFRDRRIWEVSTNDLKGVRIEQARKKRELLRKEAYSWAFAPGSQGILNDLAVEETVRGLCYAEASWWVAKGGTNRVQYGFTDEGLKVVLLLKSGKELAIEFGGQSAASFPYAGVELDGDFWICEFSWPLYRDITSYLAITPVNR